MALRPAMEPTRWRVAFVHRVWSIGSDHPMGDTQWATPGGRGVVHPLGGLHPIRCTGGAHR
nr:hypothetical protein pFRL5_17 [Streptomyces sp. F8]